MQKDEVDDVKWISIKDFKMLLDNKQAVARKGVWDCLFEKLEKI
jgi:isopentenyldiphosphate isomerase